MTDIGPEDEDWIDLEQVPAPGVLKPDVTLSLTVRNGRHASKAAPRVRATLWLRREAAAWIAANGPRFKAQTGGSACDRIRLIPDARGGKFEACELKGVQRLNLGIVDCWPNEIRRDVEAEWKITPGGLVLTLPEGFAKPGQGESPAHPVAAPADAKKSLPPPAAFPIVTRAAGLESASRAAAGGRRVLALPGEPAPGRSALDQRQRGER